MSLTAYHAKLFAQGNSRVRVQTRNRGHRESYKHTQTEGWLHIDPQSQFYDREAQPISRENALEHAAHEPSHTVAENEIATSARSDNNNDQGVSL